MSSSVRRLLPNMSPPELRTLPGRALCPPNDSGEALRSLAQLRAEVVLIFRSRRGDRLAGSRDRRLLLFEALCESSGRFM